MAELLLEGSRGEEVRRLQRNLNVALAGQRIILHGQNILPLNPDGVFGERTKTAVEKFQRDYKLRKIDGKVGNDTRNAMAMRALVIEGKISRNDKPNPSSTTPTSSPATSPVPASPPSTPASQNTTPDTNWLFQVQPAFGVTPAPFFSNGGSIATGQMAFGLVYRTASEGPHWEIGGAFQPSFNSRNTPTDPRYSLQLQGNVTFADPYSHGRFHTALFGQVMLITNLAPGSLTTGLQVGGQISFDIIEDKWNIFSQAGLQGQWTLYDPTGGSAGQLSFGPAFTVLGTTIQWDIK